MDNFDLKKYLAEGKLLKENLDFIKDLSKSKIHDVISGDQYFLKESYNRGWVLCLNAL